jgi:hypothetical protein
MDAQMAAPMMPDMSSWSPSSLGGSRKLRQSWMQSHLVLQRIRGEVIPINLAVRILIQDW